MYFQLSYTWFELCCVHFAGVFAYFQVNFTSFFPHHCMCLNCDDSNLLAHLPAAKSAATHDPEQTKEVQKINFGFLLCGF